MPIKTGIFNSDLPHHFYNKINRLALVAVGFGRVFIGGKLWEESVGKKPVSGLWNA